MGRRAIVQSTTAFERTLAKVDAFLTEAENTKAFDELLDDLEGTIIPNLERFPSMGRTFFGRPVESVESAIGVDLLTEELDALGDVTELREIVTAHDVILYAVVAATVFLLAIRHHRQLSFDFPSMNR